MPLESLRAELEIICTSSAWHICPLWLVPRAVEAWGEEVWWKGRLLGKGSLRPKAGNHSFIGLPYSEKLRFPAVTNKAKYLFLHSISFSETEYEREKEVFANSSIWAIPWLDFGSPKLSPSSPPSPRHPHPRTKGMHEGFQWLCHNKGATIAGLAPPLGEGKQILALVLGLLRR